MRLLEVVFLSLAILGGAALVAREIRTTREHATGLAVLAVEIEFQRITWQQENARRQADDALFRR